MAIQILNYTFDASAKTITFTDYVSVDKNSIGMIVNQSAGNLTIAQFNVRGLGITSAVDNIITLQFDTTGMNDSDVLAIYYNDKDLPEEIPFKNTSQSVYLKDKQYSFPFSTDVTTTAWTIDLSGFAGFTVSFKGGGTRTLDIEGGSDLITWGYLKGIPVSPINLQNKDAGFVIPTVGSGIETPLYFPKTTKYLKLTNTSSLVFGAVTVTLHHTPLSNIGVGENETYNWDYITPTTGIDSTDGVIDMTAAPGATSRWAITSIDLRCSTGTGTEVEIKNKTSGAVVWIGWVSATQPLTIPLRQRLYGSLNNILTIEVKTASNTVYATIQGKKFFN